MLRAFLSLISCSLDVKLNRPQTLIKFLQPRKFRQHLFYALLPPPTSVEYQTKYSLSLRRKTICVIAARSFRSTVILGRPRLMLSADAAAKTAHSETNKQPAVTESSHVLSTKYLTVR
jgi:hypothetical protein